MEPGERREGTGVALDMEAVRWSKSAVPAMGLALVLGGCVDVMVGPGHGRTDVAVRTTHAVVWSELSSVTDFRVSLELTNLGPGWVTYDRWCGWWIEQLVNSRWTVAYQPLCSIYNTEYSWIPPGATHYETLPAHASWRTRIGGPVTGSYRVVYEMFEDLDGVRYEPLRQDRTTSNTFTVR
jgi:hypothetical protein